MSPLEWPKNDNAARRTGRQIQEYGKSMSWMAFCLKGLPLYKLGDHWKERQMERGDESPSQW